MRKTTAHSDPRTVARDISRGVYEDVIGPHTQSHRKEQRA